VSLPGCVWHPVAASVGLGKHGICHRACSTDRAPAAPSWHALGPLPFGTAVPTNWDAESDGRSRRARMVGPAAARYTWLRWDWPEAVLAYTRLGRVRRSRWRPPAKGC